MFCYLSSVDISKVVMLLVILGLLLAGLFLQCMLHSLVYFMSCHHSNCNVLMAGKLCSQGKKLAKLILQKLSLKKYGIFLPYSLLLSYARLETFIAAAFSGTAS